jgi:hypothetical protein
MPPPRSAASWLLACAAAALLLLGTTVLLLLSERRAAAPDAPAAAALPGGGPPPPAAPAAARTAAAADVACPGAPPLPPLGGLPPGAESPPVLLWAVGGVRLSLDGAAAFSPPEAPRRFPPGEHALRLEAAGQEPLTLRLRFEPWAPALLHAQVDPGVGLTLVRLDAPCASCPAPVRRVESVAHVPTDAPADSLLSTAAAALRRGAWPEALTALEGVPPRARTAAPFLRLASVVYADARAPAAARRTLAAIPARQSPDLPALLVRLDALRREEAARHARLQLERWNLATERFSTLVERFEPQVPHAVGEAGRRLEALTRAFERAHTAGDAVGTEEALQAAEQALSTLVTRLRSARPGDCALQVELAKALKR